MFWFHQHEGKYALTESQGPFLYSRVSTFAECCKFNMPADLALPVQLVATRRRTARPPGEYIWADNDLGPVNGKVTSSPLYQWSHYHPDTSLRFTATDETPRPGSSPSTPSKLNRRPMLARSPTTSCTRSAGPGRSPIRTTGYGNGPNFQFVSTHEMNLQIAIAWYATPYQIPGNPKDQPDSTNPTWCDASSRRATIRRGVILTG